MQNYCKTIGSLAAASALVAGNASAGTVAPATVTEAAAAIEYEIHTGYTSEYLFRGANLGEDLVEVGVDIATEYNGFGLSAGAWYGSYDSHIDSPIGTVDEYDIDELDLYAEVSKDFGFLTGAIGYIYYFNEDVVSRDLAGSFGLGKYVDDAQEVYFSIGRDFGFVEASFAYYWDIEQDNDGYSELAFAKSWELNPCLALNVGTSFSYLFEDGEFGNWVTKVAIDWGFAERAKLSPFVALSVPLGDDHIYDTGDELVGGSMLSVSF